MAKDEKTYFLITQLSKDFAAWEDDHPREPEIRDLHLWNLRFQLAIVQQLSIISQHLGQILMHAKEVDSQEGAPKNGG